MPAAIAPTRLNLEGIIIEAREKSIHKSNQMAVEVMEVQNDAVMDGRGRITKPKTT
jgi:hypothetical protein